MKTEMLREVVAGNKITIPVMLCSTESILPDNSKHFLVSGYMLLQFKCDIKEIHTER